MHPNSRNHLIDLLRILAASWVVIFHLNPIGKHAGNWYLLICSYGYLGVPVFFIVSGYCILIALQHAKKPAEFIIRRLFRIFPPYWFSLMITCVAILFSKLSTGTNSAAILPKSISAIGATIALLTTPVTKVATINWVYWTLPFEVFFYLVTCACSFLKKQYFTLAIIGITLLSVFLPIPKSGPLFFLAFWPLFTLGMVLYKFRYDPSGQKWYNLALLAVTLLGFYTTKQNQPYIIACFITAVLIIIDHFKPIKNNFISKYGDVSYSLYLIHVPLGIYFWNLIQKRETLEQHLVLNITTDFCLLVILICLSGLMHKYVEIPSINYGKKLSR
ncbi:acyltransferase [Mucilaginibacter sp. HC2]|uniref:acyltransferase family protein n=1 Tax=Mucilaginibacter inviolabilis TaxID=2714892 RepID=UPI00140A7508|nr:acyltransferase [Mucilaginibacter inviolabilis]NHA05929.1 acyltransferase [Mucilaginibacter inviolabilis]